MRPQYKNFIDGKTGTFLGKAYQTRKGQRCDNGQVFIRYLPEGLINLVKTLIMHRGELYDGPYPEENVISIPRSYDERQCWVVTEDLNGQRHFLDALGLSERRNTKRLRDEVERLRQENANQARELEQYRSTQDEKAARERARTKADENRADKSRNNNSEDLFDDDHANMNRI